MSGGLHDQAAIEAAMTRDYENDLEGMSDEEIASEISSTQNTVDEEQSWLEALVTRQTQRARGEHLQKAETRP